MPKGENPQAWRQYLKKDAISQGWKPLLLEIEKMVQKILKYIKDETFTGQMVTTSAPAGNENRPLQEKKQFSF